jgi:hypothetical protein
MKLDFEDFAGKQFGTMEQQMGQDAYQSQVKQAEAHTQAVEAQVRWLDARTSIIKGLVGVLILYALVSLPAVVIIVWKAAL